MLFFLLRKRLPPRSTLSDTLFPDPTLFRLRVVEQQQLGAPEQLNREIQAAFEPTRQGLGAFVQMCGKIGGRDRLIQRIARGRRRQSREQLQILGNAECRLERQLLRREPQQGTHGFSTEERREGNESVRRG